MLRSARVRLGRGHGTPYPCGDTDRPDPVRCPHVEAQAERRLLLATVQQFIY